MPNRFENKVIAVAGGTGHIGSAVSRRLAREGAVVAIGDINLDAAAATAAEIERQGGRALAIRLDMADEDSVADYLDQLGIRFGGIDGFHANAVDASCIAGDTDPVSMDMAVFDQLTRVNMRGYFLCTRHAIPQIIRRGGGCMLYSSSGSAYSGQPTIPVYSMVKSGINALVRHVASRFGKQGVRANAIAPGFIPKPMGKGYILTQEDVDRCLERIPATRLGVPDDIAAMAALLLSDEGGYVNGQVICINGGTTMNP